MSLVMIAAPAVEPVTLAEMKERLSIDGDREDGVVLTFLAAARIAVERLVRKAMITQSWRVLLDAVPADGVVRLPLSPVQAVPAVRIADASGVLVDWPGAGLLADLAGEPARLVFRRARPVPGVPVAGIAIDVVAGYGSAPEAVPAPLRQAIALLAAHWYANRGMEPAGGLPEAVIALAEPWRDPRLA